MEPGSQLGVYRIDALLGRGGMAEVYKAFHTDLHRYEALKLLPPQMTFDPSFVERFLQEARTAAQLHHPHIATIYTVTGSEGPDYYFTMELVEGGDLADLLEKRGRIPLDESLFILKQAAEALDYAHSRGVVHRDVKPANILLDQTASGVWNVKMADFGIARAQDAEGGTRLTRTGMIVGTPEYMSPEQGGSGAPVDHRSDIYSLAVIAYEMLCGQPPFRSEGSTSAVQVIISHIQDTPRPPRDHTPALPPDVNSTLLKALSKDPADRFQSCSELMDGLLGAAHLSSPLAPRQATIAKPVGNPRPRKIAMPFGIAAAALLGLGLVAGGIYTGDRHPEPPPMSVPIRDTSVIPISESAGIAPLPPPAPSQGGGLQVTITPASDWSYLLIACAGGRVDAVRRRNSVVPSSNGTMVMLGNPNETASQIRDGRAEVVCEGTDGQHFVLNSQHGGIIMNQVTTGSEYHILFQSTQVGTQPRDMAAFTVSIPRPTGSLTRTSGRHRNSKRRQQATTQQLPISQQPPTTQQPPIGAPAGARPTANPDIER